MLQRLATKALRVAAVGWLVLHKCDRPSCVRPDHLFVGTAKDNMQDCAAKQRTTLGEKDAASVLTDAAVLAIREAVAGGATCSSLAATYGVQRREIGRVASGARWPHVGGPLTKRKPGRPRR